MIQISQEEFESKILDVIDGKNTRVELIAELKIDRSTLNNKIQELVVYNPKLYKRFIEKFPYRPREYSHIDYEALLIDILKKGYKRREWDDIYEIDSRTITRKIHAIEKTNPELINLYRKVSKYRKMQKKIPSDLQDQINLLEEREIYIAGIYDKKREELLSEEKEYQEKLMQGKKAVQASKELGKGRISKRIDTLNRIEIETRTRGESKSTKSEESERSL